MLALAPHHLEVDFSMDTSYIVTLLQTYVFTLFLGRRLYLVMLQKYWLFTGSSVARCALSCFGGETKTILLTTSSADNVEDNVEKGFLKTVDLT